MWILWQNGVMRRGIFGGTFDPIHFGHIHAIAYSINQANLDILHVMVAGDPYQKTDVFVNASQRLSWVNTSVSEFYPGRQDIVVDEREISRGGPTYTIDTLRDLSEEFRGDELVLVVGQDIVDTISTWNDADEISELSELFVVPRTIFPTSSTYIRAALHDKKPITGLLSAAIETEIYTKSLYF